MYLNSVLGVCAVSAGLVAGETIVIMAEDLDFNPSSVNASIGDILEFHFGPSNHSVVMGDMTTPCMPSSGGGFYSGFIPVSSGESDQVFQVTVNDTNPMVFYCSQNATSQSHCQSGMYGFVNQPDVGYMSSYAVAAAETSANVSPDGAPFGGVFVTNSNSTNSTANATASSTTSSTSTATSSTSPSASSTGSPKNNAGSGMAASGLLAVLAALMAV